MRKSVLLFAVAAIAGAGAGVGIAIAHTGASGATALHAQATWSHQPAPLFRLRDEAGHTLSLAALRGRTVVLTFLDSRCHTECPIEGQALAQLVRKLGPQPQAELVVVSADPWADTRASARAFAAKARWTFPWHWLLGTPAQLRPVWSSYSVAVKRTPKDVLHTLALYVIDPGGMERAAYLFPFVPAEVAADIRTLS